MYGQSKYECLTISRCELTVILLTLTGCAQHRQDTPMTTPVSSYLGAMNGCSGSDENQQQVIHICPAGVRHDAGELVVDFVVDGPDKETRQAADILQTELREKPMAWMEMKDDRGKRLFLRAPKKIPNSFIDYGTVAGFVSHVANGHQRVLVRYCPNGSSVNRGSKYYQVRLLDNDELRRYEEPKGYTVILDNAVHEFEPKDVTVVPDQ